MMDSDIDQLNQLLHRKLRAYDNYLSATLLLKKSLESDAMDAVEECIKHRGDLMRDIDELDQRLGHYRKSPALNQHSDMVRSMTQTAENLDEKLRQIVVANQDCQGMAVDRCESLKKAIMQHEREAKGLHGYTRQGQRISKFLSIDT